MAAVMALAFVVGACSGKKAESSGDPASTSLGPSIETAAPGGELGSPIIDGDDKGHYVPLKSSSRRSFLPANSNRAATASAILS